MYQSLSHSISNHSLAGGGYVAVPYPRRYDLAPSAPFVGSKDEAEVYATAAVHQLHCLVSDYFLIWRAAQYQ